MFGTSHKRHWEQVYQSKTEAGTGRHVVRSRLDPTELHPDVRPARAARHRLGSMGPSGLGPRWVSPEPLECEGFAVRRDTRRRPERLAREGDR